MTKKKPPRPVETRDIQTETPRPAPAPPKPK